MQPVRFDRQTDRQTGIECLRIFSMFLIVLGHAITHGGFQEYPLTANGFLAIAFTQGARIAVNCFVLITGFFSIDKAFSWQKVKKLYIQIWFYSAFVTICMLVLGETSISGKLILSTLLPVSYSTYWFATCYFLLLLVTPCINACIHTMQKKEMEMVLLVLVIAWSVIPSVIQVSPAFSNFAWFLFLYLLAGYSKLYPWIFFEKVKVWHGVGMLILIAIAAVLTYKMGYQIRFLHQNAVYIFAEMNKLPAVICSVLLFWGFHNWNIPTNEFLNKAASCTFGIYLFHDHPLIRNFLWTKVFQSAEGLKSPFFAARVVGSVICVFAIGAAIELLRQKVIGLRRRIH